MEGLTAEAIAEMKEKFSQFDQDDSGQITSDELGHVLWSVGKTVPGYQLQEIISEVDADKNGKMNFDEFLQFYQVATSQGVFSHSSGILSKTAEPPRAEVKVGMVHSVRGSEKVAFAAWMNRCLSSDKECAAYMPVSNDSIFNKLKDGVLLCKMINQSVPRTIDERAINKGQLNNSLQRENATLALAAAESIGCTVVNISADDINNGTEHFLLGILWQIIRIRLFADINLEKTPGIHALLEEGEGIEDLQKMSPETILLRWVNYQLRMSGSDRRTQNLSENVKTSEVYVHLLQQIAPDAGVDAAAIMATRDPTRRAELVLQAAERVDCRAFVTANDVVKGNAKLNLAFTANLFRHFPALPAADVEVTQGCLEEQRYRNWLNSTGVNPYVKHLCYDVADGLVFFKVYDEIEEGYVDWKKVQIPPFNIQRGGKMRKIGNCNYVIQIGKEKFGFDLANITGEQIHEGRADAILSVARQMHRAYMLRKVKASNDADVLEMVNKKLRDGGSSTSLQSFKDASLARKILDLVETIKPGAVNYDFVGSDELENGRYALSMARKLGARNHAIPKDVVDSNEQVVVTVFASILASIN